MLVVFSLILLLIGMPLAFADTSVSHMVIVNNQISFTDDEFISDDNEVIDASGYIITITEYTVNVGDVEVDLTHKLEFVTEDTDEEITIVNSDLTNVTILITDETILWGPESWDDKILTPTKVEVTGTIPSGYQTPDSVIQIGSEDAILVFDKTVTIQLEGVTEQMAYRLPGETTWNLISTCQGTYDSPTDPEFPNECSISNGEDTKIITFHFTEFAELEEEEEETTTSTSSYSSSRGGGKHRTGVTVFDDASNNLKNSNIMIDWVKQPITWWVNDKITTQEFSSIMGWLIDEDILKIENKIKPEKQVMMLSPSMKNLFSLWEQGELSDSIILNWIEKYREFGIW